MTKGVNILVCWLGPRRPGGEHVGHFPLQSLEQSYTDIK